MSSNAPSREQIPTVKVKKHWWEILWIDGILGIVVVVAGGLALNLALQWINKHQTSSSPSSPSSPAAVQAKSSPVPSPVAVDIIPTHHSASASGRNKEGKVYTGEMIRLRCNPNWTPSLDARDRYQQINLWAEDIIFHEDSMEIGIAVSPWDNYSSNAYLSKAAEAYITDDNGFRYDVQKDGGYYPGADGINEGDVRAIKPDEIYRFRLLFLRSRPTKKLILHHPQFKAITLLLPWADASTKATPSPTPSKNPSPINTGISNQLAPTTSATGTSSPQQSAGPLITAPEPVPSPDPACKRQLVVLKNGLTVVYIRKESYGGVTRFWVGTGYIDVDTNQISELDCGE